jgi:hypothetical protein
MPTTIWVNHFWTFTAPDTWQRQDEPLWYTTNYRYRHTTIKILSRWKLWKAQNPKAPYHYVLMIPPGPFIWVWFPVLVDVHTFKKLYDGMEVEEFREYLQKREIV